MVLLLILLTKLGQIEMFPAAKRTKNVYLIYITDRFPISPSTSMVIVQSASRRNNERRQNNCGWPIAWAWGPLSQLAVVRTCIPAITIARVYSGAAFFSTHIYSWRPCSLFRADVYLTDSPFAHFVIHPASSSANIWRPHRTGWAKMQRRRTNQHRRRWLASPTHPRSQL
jgi:hypothetical protein